MMTNIQLLLSIGIPSMLIVLSWINNNSRFDRIEKRLDDHDAKFLAIDLRFEAEADRTNARFDEVIHASHKDALDIVRTMTVLHERVAVLEAKQDR